jgi:hypothetical protein
LLKIKNNENLKQNVFQSLKRKEAYFKKTLKVITRKKFTIVHRKKQRLLRKPWLLRKKAKLVKRRAMLLRRSPFLLRKKPWLLRKKLWRRARRKFRRWRLRQVRKARRKAQRRSKRLARRTRGNRFEIGTKERSTKTGGRGNRFEIGTKKKSSKTKKGSVIKKRHRSKSWIERGKIPGGKQEGPGGKQEGGYGRGATWAYFNKKKRKRLTRVYRKRLRGRGVSTITGRKVRRLYFPWRSRSARWILKEKKKRLQQRVQDQRRIKILIERHASPEQLAFLKENELASRRKAKKKQVVKPRKHRRRWLNIELAYRLYKKHVKSTLEPNLLVGLSKRFKKVYFRRLIKRITKRRYSIVSKLFRIIRRFKKNHPTRFRKHKGKWIVAKRFYWWKEKRRIYRDERLRRRYRRRRSRGCYGDD